MSDIEWTDETWNPLRGCRRVSPGCEHCYAERQAARPILSGPGLPYEGLVHMVTGCDRACPGEPAAIDGPALELQRRLDELVRAGVVQAGPPALDEVDDVAARTYRA